MATSAVCPKCGITKKSGKMSCCGRGGSWFGNCGSAGGTKLDHTWVEGLQACKSQRQSETVISQQLKEAQQQRNGSSIGDGNANSKAIVRLGKSFAFTPVSMTGAPPIFVPVNTTTASATSTINSKSIAAVVSMPTTISTATLRITAPDTPKHTLMSRTYANKLMTTPVYTPIISQGCVQVLDITIHISFLLTVVLFA